MYLNAVLQYLGSNITEAMFNYLVLTHEKVPAGLLLGQLDDVETCTNVLQQTEVVQGWNSVNGGVKLSLELDCQFGDLMNAFYGYGNHRALAELKNFWPPMHQQAYCKHDNKQMKLHLISNLDELASSCCI